MSRAIHNNTATINTQVFVVTIYVNTNKSNPPNSNKHRILQKNKSLRHTNKLLSRLSRKKPDN